MADVDSHRDRDEARARKDEERAEKDEAREARAGAREEAKAESHDRFGEFFASMVKWYGSGTTLTGATAYLSLYTDPSGWSARIYTMAGAIATSLGMFGSRWIAIRREKDAADLERDRRRHEIDAISRKAMNAAEEGSERAARKAAESKLARSREEHSRCMEEKAMLARRIGDLETNVERLGRTIEEAHAAHQTERLLDKSRFDRLQDDFTHLLSKMNQYEGQKGDHP